MPWIVILWGLLATGPDAPAPRDPCGETGHLVGLVNVHGLLVLMAANDVVAGADSVCTAMWGVGWQATAPGDLAAGTSRSSAAAGLDWLCSRLGAMPDANRGDAIETLDRWLLADSAHDAIEEVVGAEALASAVAYVPAVADLFPHRPQETRAMMGRDIGSSLASGELNGLEYRLNDRLARMPVAELDQCLKDLWTEALKSEP